MDGLLVPLAMLSHPASPRAAKVPASELIPVPP
jgi:hypothetical protein